MKHFYLGLNLSHDSAVVITHPDGQIVAALQEERLTRKKNDYCFPKLALDHFHKAGLLVGTCLAIVIGSHRNPAQYGYEYWRQVLDPPRHPGWPPNPFVLAPGLSPGAPQENPMNLEKWLSDEIVQRLKPYDLVAPVVYVSHEDSHSALAIGASGFSSGLSVTLDGAGDNESGVIQSFDRSKGISDLVRIPDNQSLGNIYSEVTKRYAFKPVQHEGKITGLAALGSESAAVDYLARHISTVGGSPRISVNEDSVKRRIYRKLFRGPRSSANFPVSLSELVEYASRLTRRYPDLAFAVQEVLQNQILELVQHWVQKTGCTDVCLSGGVFANVKFNQTIAESPAINRVYVAPPMGDCGLAIGGIWRMLLEENKLFDGDLLPHMFLAPEPPIDDLRLEDLRITAYPTAAEKATSILLAGGMVGVFDGAMEFGPRALGSRSILMSPSNPEINRSANARLNRTEFMPFAPVVAEEVFGEIFEDESHKSRRPFSFMTMAIRVRDSWRDKIAAAIHVDGTARPQIVDAERSPLMASILERYYESTGVPVLINTSFNLHEEPIIYRFSDAIKALRLNAVDAVLTPDGLYERI